MAISMTSTLSDILAATFNLSPDLSGAAPVITMYGTQIHLSWAGVVTGTGGDSVVDLRLVARPVVPSTITVVDSSPSTPL